MIVYEGYEKGIRKKFIILMICILAIVIAMSIFGGIKLAEYMSNKKQMELAQNNENINDNKNPQNENTNNKAEENPNEIKKALTDKQIKSIENIYDIKEKTAFLTFDDGPSRQVTPLILDTLKKEDIKATFFVLGTMVKSNQEILKQEYNEGHYIANHGYSHVYNKVYADANKPLDEYNKTNKLIQSALNNYSYQSSVFRFPGGSSGRIL